MSQHRPYDPSYDEDAWQDAINEERNQRNSRGCQCIGMDMPGTCPGPDQCPMVEHEDEEHEEDCCADDEPA